MQRPRGPRTGPRPLPRNIYRRERVQMDASTPFCKVKEQCGSCVYVNQDYAEGLKAKYESGVKLLEASGVVPRSRILAPMKSPKPFEYRSLIKLAVRKQTARPPQRRPERRPLPTARGVQTIPVSIVADAADPRFQIGLFAPGSHQVVDMDDCPLHTMPLKRLLTDLRVALEASPLTPYEETSNTGQVRYLVARSAHLTGEILLTFVVTEPVKVELKRLVAELQRKGHKINSAHMNLNAERGNAIFGAETVRLAGSDRLRERLCDLDFEVGPTSFFQINPWQAINLYRRVEQIAGAPSRATVAWDLYCGTGQIALVLARLGYQVLGIEENPQAIDDAQHNAKKNALQERATFVAARVEDSRDAVPVWARSPELIVVNPSRRGLADATRTHLAHLLAVHPGCRFLYVSCAVETLARDLKELTSTGFQVRQVEPFDMFPQTDNMEWLAVLTR